METDEGIFNSRLRWIFRGQSISLSNDNILGNLLKKNSLTLLRGERLFHEINLCAAEIH